MGMEYVESAYLGSDILPICQIFSSFCRKTVSGKATFVKEKEKKHEIMIRGV